MASLVTLMLIAALIVGVVYAVKEKGSSVSAEDVDSVFKNAAIATDSTQCSDIGKNILLQGGNAVDAAIAALLCCGLSTTQSMGIGGGFFMTIYNRTSRLSTVIDARETAPENATIDMFGGNRTASALGPLSIAVPGEIKGYWLAHQKYGHLPWKSLFQPAIQMASGGFPVPIALHKAILNSQNILSTEPSMRAVHKPGDQKTLCGR
uniref:Gamma-glutamyltransferase n=1 Tax=Arion vulgaris TaxID=1028688 RepID=A0A0B7AVJ5_9EUPU